MCETGDARDLVVLANLDGGYTATKYLCDKLLREIAAIHARRNLSLCEQRLAGYQKALQEYGVA